MHVQTYRAVLVHALGLAAVVVVLFIVIACACSVVMMMVVVLSLVAAAIDLALAPCASPMHYYPSSCVSSAAPGHRSWAYCIACFSSVPSWCEATRTQSWALRHP